MALPVPKLTPSQQAEVRATARRELQRRRLLDFVEGTHPGYDAGWVHRDICERLERFSADVAAGKSPRLILNLPPRHGKALHVDTPIPTPSGWSRMGDLRVGDLVFDDTGRPTKVVAVSETWHDRELWRVMTDDGYSVLADGEHEWSVRLDRGHPVFKTYTTARLASRTSPRNPLVRIHGAVETPERRLPIDPYVLGVWLGDGTSAGDGWTATDADAAEMAPLIERAARTPQQETLFPGVVPSTLTVRRLSAPYAHAINGLRAILQNAGLLDNKHIPHEYLRASVAQRWELLRGLIDTDGHVAVGGQIEFCSMSQRLAMGVRDLVCSLGVKASLVEGVASVNGKDCGTKYRVLFYATDGASLPRKRARLLKTLSRPDRYLSFEPAGRGDTVCIEVEAASHLFLCGAGYIVTHNSSIAAERFPVWHLGRHPKHEIICVSHGQGFAKKISRKARRIAQDSVAVFPTNAKPKTGAWSVVHWTTDGGGSFSAAGIGSGIAGTGADVLVIDDYVKDAKKANSKTSRDDTEEWYRTDAYSRLSPGGGVLIIACMTGDTPVLMADGSSTLLRDICVGAAIATYDRGRIGVSTVENWINHGPDSVYAIRTKSGIVVRANRRHPFLVERPDGVREWRRTGTLAIGDRLLRAEVRGPAPHAPLTDAIGPSPARDTAQPTTIKPAGLVGIAHRPTCSVPPSTYEIVPDEIVEVVEAGTEDVFDIQVAGTENFIAKGLVSHNTRWHEDDLIGRLLAAQEAGGDQWEVVAYPAVANNDERYRKAGEALHPARFPLARLEKIRRASGERVWQALYQGKPTPGTGFRFLRKWFERTYSQDPFVLARTLDELAISVDCAEVDADGNDYTVMQVWGRKGNRYYLLYQVRDRMEINAQVAAFVRLCRQWPTVRIKLIEVKSNGRALYQIVSAEIGGCIPINPKSSKLDRAKFAEVAYESGQVELPLAKYAPFIGAYVEEHVAFPLGAHDDQVDATSQVIERWESAANASPLERMRAMASAAGV